MAGYKQHVFGATLFYAAYLAVLYGLYAVDAAYAQFSSFEIVAYVLVLYGLSLIFGLWPDVDTDSVAQRLFYTTLFFADAVLLTTGHLAEAAVLGLAAILPVLSRHRGWTHSWAAVILVPLPLLILPIFLVEERSLVGLPFYGAAVAGYSSHLVLDGLLPRLWQNKSSR